MGKLAYWLVAGILGLVGTVLAVGGAILAANSGSHYYAITGAAVLASGICLARQTRFSAWIFGAMLCWTIVWSLWEVGLDSWALMPRLVGPAIVGLLFLIPSVHRATGTSRWWVAGPSLAALLLVAGAVYRAQTAESGLPGAAKVALLPDAPRDWQHWGNSLAGTRYAP